MNSGQKATNCRSKVHCRTFGVKNHGFICNSSNRSEKLNAMSAAPYATHSLASNTTLDPNASSWSGSTTSHKIALPGTKLALKSLSGEIHQAICARATQLTLRIYNASLHSLTAGNSTGISVKTCDKLLSKVKFHF